MSAEALQKISVRFRDDSAFREQFISTPLAALADYDLTENDKLGLVLPNFRWSVEGKLAGASRPRSDDAFTVLTRYGVRALISLTEEPLAQDMLARHRLQAAHVPIADFTAPVLEQVEQAITAIDRFLGWGMIVAVHCGAGLGRTGTILACYLVHQGAPADEAITTIRMQQPGSIETPEQDAIIWRYQAHLTGAVR